MTITLNDIDEKGLKDKKYNFKKKIGKTFIKYHISHFYSDYFNKMYTILTADAKFGDNKYEFKKDFSHTLSIDDFEIEFEKAVRKFEKIFNEIITKIEIDYQEEDENEN